MSGQAAGHTAVIGGGGWGTAIAVHLARKGSPVSLWVREADVAGQVEKERVNSQFLPGVDIPKSIKVARELSGAITAETRFVVMAVPTHGMRGVLEKMKGLAGREAVFVSVAKGFEMETLKRPSELIAEVGGVAPEKICVLSGPSHAEEVGREVPTAVVAASADNATAEEAQNAFFSPRFRVYTNSDPLGVELGGALKNVIAIACGVSDGLKFGDNTKAALMTRGLAEMTRLGIALGAKRETLWGLAGLGDLIVTCASELSRNRGLGLRIGRGEKPGEILAGMKQVAEGVKACHGAVALSKGRNVVMPITQQVYAMLFEGRAPMEALEGLLSRGMRSEEEGMKEGAR